MVNSVLTKQTETDSDREKDRQTKRQKDRHTIRQTDRQREDKAYMYIHVW